MADQMDHDHLLRVEQLVHDAIITNSKLAEAGEITR
jgi:hypothetical protein